MPTSPNISEFVSKSSTGVLAQFENDFKRQQARLSEFLAKQTQLLNITQNELAKFNTMDYLQLEDMMFILKTCQVRLHAIKERMRKASKKAAKLKVRSLKIQQIKQKAALERELKREAQLTKEQEMVARSSTFQVHG